MSTEQKEIMLKQFSNFTESQIEDIRHIINEIIETAIKEVLKITENRKFHIYLKESNLYIQQEDGNLYIPHEDGNLYIPHEDGNEEDGPVKQNYYAQSNKDIQGNLEMQSGVWGEGWMGESWESFQEMKPPVLGPLYVEWCFGFNTSVPISYIENEIIIYSAAHLAILYDYKNDTLRILTAHRNDISCIAVGDNYFATCDYGPQDPIIVLWDIKTAEPIRCWVNTFATGASLVALSPNDTYLVAISADQRQTAKRWNSHNSVVSTVHIPKLESKPKHLRFNPLNIDSCVVTYSSNIIVLTGRFGVKFLTVIKNTTPKYSHKLGLFEMSIYINQDNKIVTGTGKGQVVIWTTGAQYIKTIKLHPSPIISIQQSNKALIVAFQNGALGIYTQEFLLNHWLIYDDQDVASICFDPDDTGLIPRFVVATTNGSMTLVKNGTHKHCILYRTPGKVTAMDCRPNTSSLVIGHSTGLLNIYNLENKENILSKAFNNCSITALQFSPSGNVLAMGCDNGDIMMLDPVILETTAILPSAKYFISKFCFASSDNTCIYYHNAMGLGYIRKSVNWSIRHKHKLHSKPITDMTTGNNRLYTIGEDRVLAEYEIRHSLRYLSHFEVEQSAIPTACLWHQYLLFVANSAHKIRFINVESREIIRTVQGPFSAPIQHMIISGDLLVYAAGRDVGATGIPPGGLRPQVQATNFQVDHLVAAGDAILTASNSENSVLVWQWNNPICHIEKQTFTPYIDHQICELFETGSISVEELIDKMRFLGFFPSKFDCANILIEINTPDVTEEEFRTIFWNHREIHTPTIQELRDALCCISDGRDEIEIESLIEVLSNGLEPIENEHVKLFLDILMSPRPVPQKMSIQDFLFNVLGIDPSIIEDTI